MHGQSTYSSPQAQQNLKGQTRNERSVFSLEGTQKNLGTDFLNKMIDNEIDFHFSETGF